MRVQRVVMPMTDAVSWTVVDERGSPVEPIESFLAFLSGLERSPNTVRDRAMSLKLWFLHAHVILNIVALRRGGIGGQAICDEGVVAGGEGPLVGGAELFQAALAGGLAGGVD
ncbi:MAG: hypothetical protein ACRD03_10025, partial [Acidimicrobiales bacterium]